MRLSEKSLAQLPAEISKPLYDREALGIGIVHLGIGAFHRCHMAVYTDDVLVTHGGDWKILGVSLRSNTIQQQLNPQDGLYTVAVRGNADNCERVIGSISGVLYAAEQSTEIVDAMAAATTHIVSLTVTEKGYCHDPSTGELNKQHPDIVNDLRYFAESVGQLKSAIGFLVAGLSQRKKNAGGPLTILCCDNLPSNGATVAKLVLRFASIIEPELTDWIHHNVRFPSTMVDRIVPAMEQDSVNDFFQRTGLVDEAILQTEPFTQWVIEDDFAGPRPAWEDVGVTLVSDVEPYEEAKLRMLNGSHSALAYLGYLAGFKYVHEAMTQPDLRYFIDTFMTNEAAPSLGTQKGMDLNDYRLQLQARYDNKALAHKTYQIAMDGSQKIPQRLLGTLRHQLNTNGVISACCLAVAAWMRYVMAEDENGLSYLVQDPMAVILKQVANNKKGDPRKQVIGFLSIQDIFSSDLIADPRVCDELTFWLSELCDNGVLSTLNTFKQKVKLTSP